MWTKDKAGQTEAADGTLGRRSKEPESSVFIFNFWIPSSSWNLSPKRLVLQEGSGSSSSFLGVLLTLQEEGEPGKGAASGKKAKEQGLPFIWAPRNPQGAQVVQPNPPGRLGAKELAIEYCFVWLSFLHIIRGPGKLPTTAVVKSTDSGAGAGLPGPNPGCHCLPTLL